MSVLFYPGLHQPSDARHFERAFVSINRIRQRKSPFAVAQWRDVHTLVSDRPWPEVESLGIQVVIT